MKYTVDHDYHIHSYLSPCGGDPNQTVERILQYARENGMKQVCIADHFWDENVPNTAPVETGSRAWFEGQNFEKISRILPFPDGSDIEVLFGCEVDMDQYLTLGLSKERMDEFDFIIIAATHMHMVDFSIRAGATLEERAAAWVARHEAILDMDLPFGRVGIAHMVTALIALDPPKSELSVLDMIPDAVYRRIFEKAARLGVGIEINFAPYEDPTDLARQLRPYRIARECGCKFYLGGDAHRPDELDKSGDSLRRMVELFEVEESDKFYVNQRRKSC